MGRRDFRRKQLNYVHFSKMYPVCCLSINELYLQCFSFGFPLLSIVFHYFSKLFPISIKCESKYEIVLRNSEIQLTKEENQKKNNV
jgi:hypothetical protein